MFTVLGVLLDGFTRQYLNTQWLLTDTPEMWFQRAGSLATTLIVLAEANLLNVSRIIEAPGFSSPLAEVFSETHNKMYHVYQAILLVLAMLSTIVWGYGDLIYLKWGG